MRERRRGVIGAGCSQCAVSAPAAVAVVYKMDKERIWQRLQKDVRSLLIASKNGMSIQELEKDYRMMIGSYIPVKKLDYRSTMDLLVDMPDVVNIQTNVDGTVVLKAVVNEETKNIADLVSRQKTQSRKTAVKKYHITRTVSHIDLVRRGRIAPVLPASVKSDLRDLLSISPLLVSNLETAFYTRFGRSFQYTRYGFYSLLEVLRSVSDIVQVTQTRAGSLLMLKNSYPKDKLFGSNVQVFKPYVNFKGPRNASTNALNATQKPCTPELSRPVAPKPAAPPTTLDALFHAAETKYYADKDNNKSHPTDQKHIPCESSKTEAHSSSVPQNTADESLSVEAIIAAEVTSVKADIKDPSQDCSFQGLEEKDLKPCLSHKRAGGDFSPDLRQDIRHVVRQHPEGLLVSQLAICYKQYTGKDLPVREMGFMSVLDLVGSLGDMLYLKGTSDGRDWHIFDVEEKDKKDFNDNKVLLEDEPITRWNSSVQDSEILRPQIICVTPDNGNYLSTPVDLQLPVSEADIPPDAVRKQKLCCLPRMKRGFMIGVFVENITSPSEFYIRCYNKDTSQKLEDMMIEMRCCYSYDHLSSRYVVPDDCVSEGEIYAVKVAGDVWWYRVIVHAIISSEDIQVYYPDFGNVATVKRSWLRFLKNCYMKLPAQAVPSSLAFVKPVEDQWSTEAIKSFQQHCVKGPLVGVVLQYVIDHLYLFLCDTSTEEDIYLHQLLIDHHHGSLSQDPAFYKDLQKCNPFVHYLQNSVQPQEDPQDDSVHSDSCIAELLSDQQDIEQEKLCQYKGKDDSEPELPYLEAIHVGEDIWDESWSLEGTRISLNTHKLPSEVIDEQLENPNKEQTKDDADRLPLPLEEFYISLIESRNSLEKSTVPNTPKRECDLIEKMHSPASELAPDHLPLPSEDNMTPHNSFRLIDDVENQSTKGSSPLMGIQNFQIPRRSTTMALGPAARLATSPSNLLHWVPPDLR